jgi:large subunit ribosomal protein L30
MDKELNINMAKVKITQVKSRIKTTTRQKRTLDALGLRRNNSTVELEITPQINGMINKVRHLVKVEES